MTEPPSRSRRFARLAWLCLPVVAWLAVLALASTDLGSSAHSTSLLERLVDLLSGSRQAPSPDAFDVLSWVLRKGAHLVEYAVLGLLAARAVRGLFPDFTRSVTRPAAGSVTPPAAWEALWRTAALVLPFGVLVAAADELHQTFVASRNGSPWDALIDVLGLVLGVVVAWLVRRRRPTPGGRPGPEGGERPEPRGCAHL